MLNNKNERSPEKSSVDQQQQTTATSIRRRCYVIPYIKLHDDIFVLVGERYDGGLAFLGGGAKKNEDNIACAMRELEEEVTDQTEFKNNKSETIYAREFDNLFEEIFKIEWPGGHCPLNIDEQQSSYAVYSNCHYLLEINEKNRSYFDKIIFNKGQYQALREFTLNRDKDNSGEFLFSEVHKTFGSAVERKRRGIKTLGFIKFNNLANYLHPSYTSVDTKHGFLAKKSFGDAMTYSIYHEYAAIHFAEFIKNKYSINQPKPTYQPPIPELDDEVVLIDILETKYYQFIKVQLKTIEQLPIALTHFKSDFLRGLNSNNKFKLDYAFLAYSSSTKSQLKFIYSDGSTHYSFTASKVSLDNEASTLSINANAESPKKPNPNTFNYVPPNLRIKNNTSNSPPSPGYKN